MAVWGIYDLWFKNYDLSSKKYYNIAKLSFFLFVFHEPILTIVKKAMFYALGTNEIKSLLIYLVAPIVTITICLITGYIIKNKTSKLNSLITGNR